MLQTVFKNIVFALAVLAVFVVTANLFKDYAGLLASTLVVTGLTIWRVFNKKN
jgi:hypothetical protein